MMGTVQAMDSDMTCEVYGMLAIWGMIAPKPEKKLTLSTTGFTNQVITGGITNPACKVIRTTTLITIRINRLLKNWF
jgi:hypothetical protein